MFFYTVFCPILIWFVIYVLRSSFQFSQPSGDITFFSTSSSGRRTSIHLLNPILTMISSLEASRPLTVPDSHAGGPRAAGHPWRGPWAWAPNRNQTSIWGRWFACFWEGGWPRWYGFPETVWTPDILLWSCIISLFVHFFWVFRYPPGLA